MAEAGNNIRDVEETVNNLIEAAKDKSPVINPMFMKKGDVIYDRGLGYKLRNTDGKGGREIVSEDIKADDTFPPKETPPYYIFPINN